MSPAKSNSFLNLRLIIFIIAPLILNIVSLAEGACLRDQTRLNTIRDKTNYLIETTVECGFKNANNLYVHLRLLGINGNVVKAMHLKGWDMMSIKIVTNSLLLTDYLTNYWVNYYDSILNGVPTSSQGMAGK